ncbi:MAG: hypothetical protein KDA81_05310 [Planctomycetaceae bacterium]|nr:hypothetical protein [Planctomycetaceae bacterium]
MAILRQVLLKIWHGQPLLGDDLVALCLLLAMLASLAHLLTMLVTRWGDHHIAAKSLLASILVHAVCLLSLEVFDPLQASAVSDEQVIVNIPEAETEITIESDELVQRPSAGNTPVPEAVISPKVNLQRLTDVSRRLETDETLSRDVDVPRRLQSDFDDVSPFIESDIPQTASVSDAGNVGPPRPAVSDPVSDLTTMLKDSLLEVQVLTPQRLQTQPGALVETAPAERSSDAGRVSRIENQLEAADLSLPVATSDASESPILPVSTPSEAVRESAAPASGADPGATAGPEMMPNSRNSAAATSLESRLSRPPRSTPSNVSDRHPARFANESAQTTIPLSSDYDDVRMGATEVDMTDALTSAASLLDSESHTIRRRESRRATYRLRTPEHRRDAAEQFGGTRQSEAAVELSLKWLNAMQSRDGHWDAETFGAGQVDVDEQGVERNFAGRDADTGLTALVTLSFLGAGYTHEGGRYALTVDRALNWLISQQRSDGSLSGKAGHYAAMYCHAMATYALAEAVGMQGREFLGPIVQPDALSSGPLLMQAATEATCAPGGFPVLPHVAISNAAHNNYSDFTAFQMRLADEIRLRAALVKAVAYTISQQDPRSGGWRYEFGQEGDVSMFGWQMMSLRSADIAGVSIDPVVRDRMVMFLNGVRQGDRGGLFGYRRPVEINGRISEPVTPVMTAEALFCQQMLGYPRDSDAGEEAVEYLLDHLPRVSEFNLYYWYYGTLAMYQFGGGPWERWNSAVRDPLIDLQRRDGRFAGSWDPNDPWGPYGGRLYSTAIATLTLEVYYRLLPLYRMNTIERRQP